MPLKEVLVTLVPFQKKNRVKKLALMFLRGSVRCPTHNFKQPSSTSDLWPIRNWNQTTCVEVTK